MLTIPGIIEVKESQTASYLKDQIMSTISAYGLTTEQIFSVTCDNGANMLAAVRHLKKDYEEHFVHVMDGANDEVQDIIDQPNTNEEEMTASLSDELQENLNLVRCAVHTLQLAILDVVNKSNEHIKKFTELAKKCRSIKYTKFFELHGAHYSPIWGQTRWGGIYLMIARFLEQRSFFEKLAEQFKEFGNV